MIAEVEVEQRGVMKAAAVCAMITKAERVAHTQ